MKTLDQFRSTLSEGVIATSDYKIGEDGRKHKAHRFTFNANSKSDQSQTNESVLNVPKDPPFVLVLKREAIRYYPNNTKVALYYNAKLDKHFTIPYGQDVNPGNIQAEDIELNEASDNINEEVMDTLHQIHSEKQAKRVKFADGSTRKVDGFTASAIVGLHNALNDSNKQKLRELVHKSPVHLMKAANLAFKHVK